MPRRKPIGWPKLMRGKQLKGGTVAYFWEPPTWARKAKCPVRSEPLGVDYAIAKTRCDDVLNPQFDAWRRKGEISEPNATPGTFDWMASLYKSNPKYRSRPVKTRKSFDSALAMVAKHRLKDGRLFGGLSLASITPGAADRLFAKLKERPDGGERVRTALLAMQVCRRAWNVAHRDKPEHVPLDNPFARMGLSTKRSERGQYPMMSWHDS
jgi:hypothetical protein